MKPQRVYAEIDLSAICHNVEESMRRVGDGVKIMGVIKTDAYGHGAMPVAQALNSIGVDAYAVATVDEGVDLRMFGIDQPILILGHVFEDELTRAIMYRLTLTVSSYEEAKQISQHAGAAKTSAVVHAAVDTGMGRIGFQPTPESVEELKKTADLPNLTLEGLFTHFACADEADKTSMDLQIRKFTEFSKALEDAGVGIAIHHMCNSAAVMERDDDFRDMVRLGITIYGLLPSNEVQADRMDLKPALSLVSHVSHVKTVGPGFPVSYGSTFVTERDSVIATIPVGYGDGYPRSLSNKGSVLIHGKRAPIVGRVCMDQFMVDVTDIPDVNKGDEAVLIGYQESEHISAEEVGDLSGRFNYELMCDINKRVPRIYKYEG